MAETTITVIDYGMGNPGSIMNMLKHLGIPAILSADLAVIARAERLILPGVGAFDAGMARLEQLGLIPVLEDKVSGQRTPFLGICLGMQLLSQRSEEGSLAGLGWIDAETIRFDFSGVEPRPRIPHMGWNELSHQQDHPLLEGLEEEGTRFYFVHGYHVRCRQTADVVATSVYGYPFHAVIGHGHILGTQFHPEKSHRYGMRLLTNFARFRP